ncbi:response regulator transcription factor [Saccharopolyspora sp. K220]|uniref:response regulator n=1 Tax=Saccharopolyspora soli TaxID=2926618 RepID=UPI001F5927C8|nr:response regulator transcription factor [Saccharopolyspora soli]MCI2417812.1 response regulator transcription factor [Saccharopolyspora soli]
MTIRVLIADDQAAVRSALRLVLDTAPGVRVVGEAADGAEAIRQVRSRRPDVAVIDIRMPKLDGIAVIRALTGPDAAPVPAIIVLTTFDLDEYLFEALRVGATGFLLKDNRPQLLVDAVHAAARGHGLIDPQVTGRLVRRFATLSPRPASPELGRLTAREREVLSQVARGLSNGEIARALWIEEGTVKTHVAPILAKLGLRTRVHAVIYAHEHGLALPSDP